MKSASFQTVVSWRRCLLCSLVLACAMALTATQLFAQALPIADGSWTLAVLPDTQVYARAFPQHFDAQTQWIVDHAETHNIRYVLHEGDITDDNVVEQWDNALHSMKQLDGAVPYAMAPGNHDNGPGGKAGNRVSSFNDPKYFGPGSPYAEQTSIGGFFEPKRTENSYHTFEAAGQPWLVLALEWAPRDETIAWANEIVQKHPDHLVMLVTHAFVYFDDTRYDWADKGVEQHWNPHAYGLAKLPSETVNDGQQLWNKLVSRHENFRFVFNGHVLGDGTGRLSSVGANGNTVHQMLANYQFKTEGGQGDMRLLEFKADGKTVVVRTYSPVLKRYDTADDEQFTLEY